MLLKKRQKPLFFVTAIGAFVAIAMSPCLAAAGTESLLYSFHPQLNGQLPGGGVISDSAGNLYGVTQYGGAYNNGAVYMLSPNAHGGWTETVLYSFKGSVGGAADGYNPVGALTFDSAGNLYGATTWGGNGKEQVGTVFKLTKSNGAWNETIVWSFQQSNSKDGFNPQGGLIFDKAGNLYGTTRFGGGYTNVNCSFDGGCGTVFQLSPNSNGQWKESLLYVFQGLSDGGYPNDSLAMDSSGNLYGTTVGSATFDGTAVEVSPGKNGDWTETTLFTFSTDAEGTSPTSGLILDQAGNLDGVTFQGGSECSTCGTVFQLIPGSNKKWTEKILFNFNGTDGQNPSGKLQLDQNGNLYGTAAFGGTSGEGVVFGLTPAAGGQYGESVLWNFTGGTDGETPSYGVILGAGGKLYGANSNAPIYGVVFELAANKGEWNETTLTSFQPADGGIPQAALVADAAGDLYGVTSQDGTDGYGTVFKLTKSSVGWNETILYDFTTGAPIGPYKISNPSTLIFDSAGNLYGETEYGGSADWGMVYELSPTSHGEWTEKTLFTFKGTKTGIYPLGGLVFDSVGNLYGTTKLGGIDSGNCFDDCGVVFELTPAQGEWKETVLYNFLGGNDGAYPLGGVIFDKAGNLYGTTSSGALIGKACDGCGTVFKLTHNSGGTWTESLLHRFSDTQGDGAVPAAGVIFDEAGNLYGTTSLGGAHGICNTIGCGVVYELSPQSGAWRESILYAFLGSDATTPLAGVIFDQAGNLYGTTEGGLYGDWGSVFELSPASGGGWSETSLYTFPTVGGGDGYFPEASVILGPSGVLYGTTAGGGQGNGGTVFQITP